MTKIAHRFGVLLAAAAFGLVLQAGAAQAQSTTSSFPSATFTPPSYTPPPTVKTETPPQIGTPQRNMPMPEIVKAPVIPGAQVTTAAQPRRAALNRLENRLTTEQARPVANTSANTQDRAAAGRQLLESAQPIL